jgi:uncharacterized membrane protein
MSSLVTRFHLLFLSVTLAISGVGLLRIPADFEFPARWAGSAPDWVWPRDLTLVIGPVLQIVLLGGFFLLGKALTKNHFSKTQHILDPALSLCLAVIASTQLGLLFVGIGSDLPVVRLTAVWLGLALLLLGLVLFEAERHTYAGLRMPWPIRSDAAWRLVHRSTGVACALAGVGLLTLAWLNADIGTLIAAFGAALTAPTVIAGVMTVLTRG